MAKTVVWHTTAMTAVIYGMAMAISQNLVEFGAVEFCHTNAIVDRTKHQKAMAHCKYYYSFLLFLSNRSEELWGQLSH